MAQAGWYPDPGGVAGLYRYWDGKAWSAVTSASPSSPPPSQTIIGTPTANPAQTPATRPQPVASQTSYRPGQPVPGYGTDYRSYQQIPAKRRRFAGWWIGIGAVVVVLALVIVFVVRGVTGSGGIGSSSGQGSEDACPSIPSSSISAGQTTGDGRVHGGPISYPELGSPWGTPSPDDRVPFGTDVLTQDVFIEPNYDGLHSWVASVLIGQLIAGDGFFSPEQGSQIVVKCIIGAFYDNAVVTRDDKVNQATTVDGHQAWIVKTHLSFDIPKLRTKGETATIVIISAGVTSGLFYSSIPDTSPQLQAPADQVLKELTVD